MENNVVNVNLVRASLASLQIAAVAMDNLVR